MSHDLLRYRLSVASRVLAGFGGGYAITSMFVAVVPMLMPGQRAVALLWTNMFSFFLYAAIVMAVFHARSAVRAWACLLAGALPLGLLLAWLGQGVRP